MSDPAIVNITVVGMVWLTGIIAGKQLGNRHPSRVLRGVHAMKANQVKGIFAIINGHCLHLFTSTEGGANYRAACYHKLALGNPMVVVAVVDFMRRCQCISELARIVCVAHKVVFCQGRHAVLRTMLSETVVSYGGHLGGEQHFKRLAYCHVQQGGHEGAIYIVNKISSPVLTHLYRHV